MHGVMPKIDFIFLVILIVYLYLFKHFSNVMGE